MLTLSGASHAGQLAHRPAPLLRAPLLRCRGSVSPSQKTWPQYSRCVSRAPAAHRHRFQATLAGRTEQQAATEEQAPPGCARYTAVLGKPLGLVLEERKSGGIFVAEVAEGGNAERDGQISVGDELIATSGRTHTREMQYQDNIVKTGEQMIRLTCRGESFTTIMAAIGSHQAHHKVTLEFQRCDPSQQQQ